MSAEINKTPGWVKNAVFYQIFPDRFAFSKQIEKPQGFEPWDSTPTIDGFKGGDLMGVVEKLDYLDDLGINAIYFNPVFQSASNHRYHTHDYYQVDPLLGGNSAFKTLLDAAHKRSIRVVLDGVFNHASRGFFQFNHILEVGAKSPYQNWFHIHGFPLHAYEGNPNYACWWNLPGLPKLNTSNPQVRKFIFDVAHFWIDQGIDGWRIDVPLEINDDDFWREFRSVVKTANPEAYIAGEIPFEAQRWLKGDIFDGVMNYQLTHACLSFFGGPNIDSHLAEGLMGLNTPKSMDASQFAQRSEELLSLYPHDFTFSQLNLLDSHDMPRFLSLVSNDKQRLYLAFVFLFTYPGAPCIYYGDEIGMNGGKDPECRKSFLWDKFYWDSELREKIKDLIMLRHAMPVLRDGDYLTMVSREQLLTYSRKNNDDIVFVIINMSNVEQILTLEVGESMEDGTRFQDQIGTQNFIVENKKIADIHILPLSAYVLA